MLVPRYRIQWQHPPFRRPLYYRRDGSPYDNGDLIGATMLWGREFGMHGNREVALAYTPFGARVSTVWLGLDHGFVSAKPLIFETMVFDRHGHDVYQARYSTEEEARIGHERAFFMACVPARIRTLLSKFVRIDFYSSDTDSSQED